MRLLQKDDIRNHVQNIVHEDTQLHQNCIDLTVNKIAIITGPGSLDFGGSEFKPADTKPVNPKKKNADDDYGWWELNAGVYSLTFNEQISAGQQLLAIMDLHPHARKAGLTAGTQIIEESGALSAVFRIPEAGCNIKENARLATLHLFQA